MIISKNKAKNSKKRLRAENKARRFREKYAEFENNILISIKKPKKDKEIYLQVNLYNKLNILGYDVYLEVPHKIESKSVAVFDIVVFHPIRNVIIELKRKGQKVTNKQIDKYCKFDAELLFCIGREQIYETLEYIKLNYPI